jgi:23S rRNA (cytosine1962-C5)-methyltransferase
MQIAISLPVGWDPDQYALLDSGEDFKLERFGDVVLARPDPQAIWRRHQPASIWQSADATFRREAEDEAQSGHGAHWLAQRQLPETWPVHWRDLTLLARLTPFKHTGIFPEQSAQWDWLAQRVAGAGRAVRVLNLFGYTGAATLAAAHAGAQVTHVDASPKSVEWARENQAASGLADASIRWLVDDALKFVRREARRDSHYDLVVMDPPAFGRGPKGELWKFEESLPELLDVCCDILTPRPLGFLITSYSIRASSILLHTLLGDAMARRHPHGTTAAGELALAEADTGRLLSTAIYARWEAS